MLGFNVMKNWDIAPEYERRLEDKFPEINPIILQLLYNRGLDTQEKIDEFLMPDYSQDIHNPFLLQDMEKSVERIYQAIENDEKIAICGDYDADGITGTAVLYFIFKKLGAKNLVTYIPDRETEGYGLNEKLIKKLLTKKIKLIITCDCGITNVKEIDLAKQAGLDVIITDHHCQPEKIPDAFAIINPQLDREKYPFKSLAGVGVAFKLIQALLHDSRCQIENCEGAEKWLLDLVAVGTVADCMPLLGENRTLVKYGLVVLNKSSNKGLRALIEKSNLSFGDLDTTSITYQISPRLNAASRIKHADEAFNLILTQDEDEAEKMALTLNEFNKKRQQLVEKTFEEIKNQIGPSPKEKILVVLGQNWPKGVLGLSANKTLEQYSRPAIILAQKETEIAGSGRSIPNFNIYQALMPLKKYFSRFGGHAVAFGLALKEATSFENFKKEVEKIGQEQLNEEDLKPRIKIDAQVDLKEVNWRLYEELKKFEPFGKGNDQPNFLVKNVYLDNWQMVGQNGRHCRIIVGNGRKMIYFDADDGIEKLKTGDYLDIVFQLGINQWNGQQELQLKVMDLKKSEARNLK